ncbi:MAG: exodeoxyribonuclease VII small subunit [Chloroflexi bacterium]|nr:exodeoxyribonuclease VII small subunit [Chloroflexota bacterium]
MAREDPLDVTPFEEAYEQLRKCVGELEAGPLSIEEALARYEEGVRLANLCNKILDQAELRIEHVLREPDSESLD